MDQLLAACMTWMILLAIVVFGLRLVCRGVCGRRVHSHHAHCSGRQCGRGSGYWSHLGALLTHDLIRWVIRGSRHNLRRPGNRSRGHWYR